MTIGSHRVQIDKHESTSGGGDDADTGAFGGPTPIEPQEDAIESAGHYLQDASARDENVYIERNGDNLRFRDQANTTPVTLSDLVAGAGGLTIAQHKILRQLIHFIADGPAEGFASGAYKERLPSGSLFPTSVTWYVSSSKTQKIVERNVTWSGVTVTVDEWKVYDTDGSTLIATVSDSISYSGLIETTRTRTITVA